MDEASAYYGTNCKVCVALREQSSKNETFKGKMSRFLGNSVSKSSHLGNYVLSV